MNQTVHFGRWQKPALANCQFQFAQGSRSLHLKRACDIFEDGMVFDNMQVEDIMKKPTLKLRLLSPLWIVIGLTILIISLSTGQVYGQVLDADRVKQEIEQTDNIIEQARKSVDQSRDQRTTALLQQAEQAQERAREYLERGRLAFALQFTLRAREAARHCIGSMVRSDDDRSIVEQQLDRTDELLEQIRTIQNGRVAYAGLAFAGSTAPPGSRTRLFQRK